MSKRKAKPNSSSAARPVSPPASVEPKPVKPGPATAPPQAVPNRRTPWIWLAAGAIVLLGLLALVMVVRPANQDGASLAEAPAAAPTGSGPIGGVTGCRKLPNFAKSVGFTEQAALSTSESQEKGLVLIDLADANHRYQHPTWTQLGYLGPITYDSQGNVYVAPTPHVSLIENPPEQQTTIFRADTDTGELAEFLKLEPVTPPTGHPLRHHGSDL